MKSKIYIIVIAVLTGLISMAFAHKSQSNEGKPFMHFENLKHNYGKIEANSDGNYIFKFTNTGDSPLIISEVHSSCGCTVAKKPKEPILPGESDEIKVRYNTAIVGFFRKNIRVISNAENSPVVLEISGEVSPKPKEVVPLKQESKGFTPIAL